MPFGGYFQTRQLTDVQRATARRQWQPLFEIGKTPALRSVSDYVKKSELCTFSQVWHEKFLLLADRCPLAVMVPLQTVEPPG